MNSYFITATGTDVGKTIVTAGLLRHLRQQGRNAISMKPVQTGADYIDDQWSAPDLEVHWKAAAMNPSKEDRARMAPYTYAPACSPHLAGRLAGTMPDLTTIQQAFIALEAQSDSVLVEGAGGIYAPLNESETMLDLMKQLGLPVIIVAHRGLGTLNHTLLSIEALRHAGLTIAGVVLNEVEAVEPDFIKEDNPSAIETFGQVPIVGNIDYLYDLENDPDAAWAQFEHGCRPLLTLLQQT